jgi:hypothetical protein
MKVATNKNDKTGSLDFEIRREARIRSRSEAMDSVSQRHHSLHPIKGHFESGRRNETPEISAMSVSDKDGYSYRSNRPVSPAITIFNS